MRPELEKAFKALDVPFGATKSEIRLAYRSLVRAHHRAHGAHVSDEATERLAEINAAKDLLDRIAPAAPTRQRRTADVAQRTEAPASDARSPVDERSRREADARAVRKANEARTDTELTTVRYTRTADTAATLSQRHMRKSADVMEKEEASRRRSAAFAAAIGGDSVDGRRSIFTRLTRANAR
jgi:curved DNA-binding protein CbpA